MSSYQFPTGMPSFSPTASPYAMFGSESSLLMLISSILTCVGCLIIFILCIMYADLRKKSYVKIILYASIGDFISGISTSFGELQDETPLCWAQAFISNWFTLSSIFWTVAITYLLYTIIVIRRPMNETVMLHGICWGLPLLLTLLPLTTNRFGARHGANWCFIQNRADSPSWGIIFWVLMSFYAWIGFCMLIILVLIFLISYHTLRFEAITAQLSTGTRKNSGVNKLWLYPAVILVCWLVPSFTDTYETLVQRAYPLKAVVDYISFGAPLCKGLLNSLVFCFSTEIVRKRIYNMSLDIRRSIVGSSIVLPQRSVLGLKEDPNPNQNKNLKYSVQEETKKMKNEKMSKVHDALNVGDTDDDDSKREGTYPTQTIFKKKSDIVVVKCLSSL